MEKQLKTAEIARIAMTIEEKGSNFYSALAGQVEDERAKQVFKKLAEEEKEHRRVFEKIHTTYDSEELLDPEASAYLTAVIKGNVFPGASTLKNFVEGIRTVKDALAIGVQAEKDAILLYHELITRTKSEKARKMLYDLLEEEKMHLTELRNYFEEL